MTNTSLLKYYIAKSNIKAIDLIKVMGISEATYYRKVNGNSEFTRNEIQAIKDTLNLSMDDIGKIFFNQKLA
ncbi:helix-turn-helix domain-containing protein [Peptostreptococcus stomatis]